MPWNRIDLILALLLLSGCGAAVEEVTFQRVARTELPGEVIVPLLSDNDPIIEGTIPGHGSGRFMVDTGAQVTVLDPGFVARCGLPLKAFSGPATVSRSPTRRRVLDLAVRVPRLNLGRAVALDLTPPVIDLSHMEIDLDGIVGQDILKNWIVLFDAPRAQLRFLPSGQRLEHLERLMAPGTEALEIPVRWTDRRPYMDYRDAETGEEFPLLIDTGATVSGLPSRLLQILQAGEEGRAVCNSIYGPEEHKTWRVKEVNLGKWRISDLLVSEEEDGDGRLGYHLFKSFVFLLDGPEETFLLMYKVQWK